MTYTTHGLMTPADRADHDRLYDTGTDPHCTGHYQDPFGITFCSIADDCPGEEPDEKEKGKPMDTFTRLENYFNQSPNGRTITARQRRRMIKKAGRDREYTIMRDTGMGYSPARQGMKELSVFLPAPVSGQPY